MAGLCISSFVPSFRVLQAVIPYFSVAKKCFLIDLRIWKDQLPCGRMKYGMDFVLSPMLMCTPTQHFKNFVINPKRFVRGHLCGGGEGCLNTRDSIVIVILVINQHKAQILFYNKFILCLYMFRALCTHHQEVKIVLYSIWYRHIL